MNHVAYSKTPAILDKVASLTTIRDTDIFEFSFLKTLAEMLKTDDIRLYKLGLLSEPCRLIRYSSSVEYTDKSHRTDESKVVHIEHTAVPDEIKNAHTWISSTGKIYSVEKDDGVFLVYPVGVDSTVAYLALTLSKKPTDIENLIITSLLNISQNFYELLKENQTDKLTGLLNRKTFDDNVTKIRHLLSFISDANGYRGREKRGVVEYGEFWLALFDIDFFKNINDTWGHIFGDEILLLITQVFKQTFRPNDLLFRFGGEEFVVVVKVGSKAEAEQIFDRLRTNVEKTIFPQVGQLTVTLGATQILEEHAIASEIIGKADKALYHGKHNGRNQLFFYEDLLRDGLIDDSTEEGDIELF